MRNIGPDQHQIARREATDIVADETVPLRIADEMQFVFRMVIPACERRGEVVTVPIEAEFRILADAFEDRGTQRGIIERRSDHRYQCLGRPIRCMMSIDE